MKIIITIIFIVWCILFFAGLMLKDSKNETKSGIGYTILSFTIIGYLALIIIIGSYATA